MKLLIFYLTDNRRHFTFPHYINLLKDSKYKNDWKFLVLTHTGDTQYYETVLHNTGIQFETLNVPADNNYMVKVHSAVAHAERHNIPYMMKCDNDIFLHSNTLDTMIENLPMLEDGKHLTLGPILSSGIPSVEYFVNDFLPDDEKKTLENMYLKTSFYNRDGASYEHLNAYTHGAKTWEPSLFFNAVKTMGHHYKGVHPIRFSYDANKYLNDCILHKKEAFFNQSASGIFADNTSPYLCDSIFCIKRETYKTIINDGSLFVDPFDEVPLNKYAWANGMSHLFVKGGYAIHITYNWNNDIIHYEREFCTQLFH